LLFSRIGEIERPFSGIVSRTAEALRRRIATSEAFSPFNATGVARA